MIVTDKIYGREEITEPVLIELIQSKPLQRLKGVNQAGSQLVQPHRKYSRFDHCLGVMILLKRFQAPLEEQIAGLLHDVSHPAFSHVVDFAFGEGETQTFHEKFAEKIVFNSEIPKILEINGINASRVVNPENFPLLEQPLPALCADRIDYFIKESTQDFGLYPEVTQFLDHIKVHKNQFVFDNQRLAKRFALMFMKECSKVWTAPKTLAIFVLLAETIKRGLEIGVLTQKDLFGTDHFVYQKLKKSSDRLIKENLALLNPNLSVKTVTTGGDFHSKGKVRYVDPKILTNGHLAKLSDLDRGFSKKIKEFKEKVSRGHKIKILR